MAHPSGCLARYGSSICSIGCGQSVLSEPRRRILGSMHVLGPPLPLVCATLSRPPSPGVIEKTLTAYTLTVSKSVRIIRLFRIVRIELARNLDELLPEIREKPSQRDYKWATWAMSRPSSRNLVRLDLLTHNRRANGTDKTPSYAPFSTTESGAFLVHSLPVIVIRGSRARVHHNCAKVR